MKIGVFDSGLGGLIVLKSIVRLLPNYDYLYLGDTKNLPYGEKTQSQIYRLLRSGVDFLFKNNCALIIVACNTASANALRKIQQTFLPKNYPSRKVLGVIRPTVEEAAKGKKAKTIIVIGTRSTIRSKSYIKEIAKINHGHKLIQISSPSLVPLIEKNNLQKAQSEILKYVKPVLVENIDSIILGCTHYPILKTFLKSKIPKAISIISQDDLIPDKLLDYLIRHPEIQKKLSRQKTVAINLTKYKSSYKKIIDKWFSKKAKLKFVKT